MSARIRLQHPGWMARFSVCDPIISESGEVIGAATLVTGEGQNLGFAIAVEGVERALTLPESN